MSINVNERLCAEIEKALENPRATEEDRRVLTYIGGQISPEGLEKRATLLSPGVDHLHEVARERLRGIARKGAAVS